MCGIAGLINRNRVRENGERIKRGIVLQNDRGNGLGAGFAVYGAYPRYKDFYALHVMSEEMSRMEEVNKLLEQCFNIVHVMEMPVWNVRIKDHPFFRVVFVDAPEQDKAGFPVEDKDTYTLDNVVQINQKVKGAFIYGSGKDVGIFKGVGFPGDIYDFFQLNDYEGYLWLAHNRFPTNTPGWWGGAHPFNMLNYSIVHNGELSSYGINKRYLESFGYSCDMQTDSEVVAYLLDLLIRKHRLSVNEAVTALAPPYWSSLERMESGEEKDRLLSLKLVYESAMLNGPFAVLAAFHGGMFTLTDHTKLRPITVGYQGECAYFAGEVAALYEMEEDLHQVLTPRAGEPCLISLTPENSAEPVCVSK